MRSTYKSAGVRAEGLRFGVAGVDWKEGIDFARMRNERLAKAQAAMKEHGIAACLLMGGENIRYVTGVRGPHYAFGLRYALAFAEYDPIVYELGDTLDHNRIHASWVQPENWRCSYSWLGGICGPDAAREEAKKWADAIVEDLRNKGLAKEKLGVDMVDGAGAQALADAGVQIVDAMPALTEARRIKTKDEIGCMKMAVAIANAGFYSAWQTMRPGIRQCDVTGPAMDAIIRAGAEYPFVGVMAGPNTFDLYHVQNDDKIIDPGDLVQVQLCGTSYMGYNCCIYRTFTVGRKPNAKEKGFYSKCYERVYSVIEAIKPGANTADAAKNLLPAGTWGYETEEALLQGEVGHGQGLGLFERPVINRSFSLDHPQPFEPGMVIAVECREGERGYGGVRLEEMVVVTETGNKIITTWPSEEIMPAAQLIT